MHCPSCGQQQVSQETKFCSRCGMPLSLVSEVVANGGFLPQLAELHKGKQPFLTRKNGVIFSLIWFVIWVMMLPAFIGLAGGEDAAAVPAIFGVFTTMIFLIASLGFLKKTPKAPLLFPTTFTGVPESFPASPDRSALPPVQSIPVSQYGPPQAGHWRDTNDLQPSVTEGTTKLLEKDDRRTQ